jgi:hypothetical protein
MRAAIALAIAATAASATGRRSLDEGPPPPPPAPAPRCQGYERDALVDLYLSTAGPDAWLRADGWATEGSCCDWFGVTCRDEPAAKSASIGGARGRPLRAGRNSTSAVVKLRLRGNGLRGTLPESMGLLVGLEELVLAENSLTGTLPPTLTNLTAMRKVYLHYNGLSGEVPSIAGMQQLHFLHLGGQGAGGLTGGLGWLGELPALEEVLLWDNGLEGPFPETMRNLSALGRVEIARNPLNCAFPEWLGELGGLTELSAYDNGLTGTLPASLGGFGQPKLERLFVRGNRISGTIAPELLGNLPEMVELNLGGNMLSGSLPETVGRMAKLQKLVLWENLLEGALPTSISEMGALTELRLSENAGMTTIDPEMEKPPLIGEGIRWLCNLGSNSWKCPVPDWAKDQCSCSCSDSATGHRNGTKTVEV